MTDSLDRSVVAKGMNGGWTAARRGACRGQKGGLPHVLTSISTNQWNDHPTIHAWRWMTYPQQIKLYCRDVQPSLAF